MAIEVREAFPDEHARLGDLVVQAYHGLLLDEAYARELRDVARRAEQAVVLAAVDEHFQLLGCVTYVPGPGPYAEFEAEDEAGIRMLAVTPAAQRRGVGELLVRGCVVRAQEEGKARLSLFTTPRMQAAQRLYERLGFRRAPERDRQPTPEVRLIGYVLELRAES